MSDKGFVHLHTHSEYSMLDGASRVQELVKAVRSDGQSALGITDHGNMYGALEFYKSARAQGINPIIGFEAYMAKSSRQERPQRRGKIDDTGGDVDGGEKLYYHLTLLAESTLGYHNLIQLSSAAYLEGYYYKPRLDFELLERYHEGVIATTGCLGGLVLQALLRDDEEEATQVAGRLQDIFGRDSLFVELQDQGLPEQHRTNPGLISLAKRINAPLLATNDSHYTHRSDAVVHDALLCVQTGATLQDEKRFRFHGEEHYLKTAAEMRSLFREVPEACDNTLWIAERAHVEIEFNKPKLPEFEVPAEFRAETYEVAASRYLRHLTFEGAKERYGDPLAPEVRERLDYELGVISEMGFSAYFLVVGDLISFARASKIRVGPGRGSAAGCCVAYCLGIVDLDPIRYDLLFERFLNPGRKQMPDIDMDFDERYRADMIRYASEKYGQDHVAQIVTFSTIKARAAVRDAARVLGMPYAVGDRAAKAMPPLILGRDTPIAACLELQEGYEEGYKMAAELREMVATDREVGAVIEVAKGLEGLRRQDGIHAAAVVITHAPLTEYLPIQRKPDPGGQADLSPVVTQYEMHGVEELGLLKMDFLGLRTLAVIERAVDLVESSTGTRVDIDHVPLDDATTFAMLQRSDTIGVFQLESGPMRTLMRSLAPTSFDDIAALVALYRPGPMAANMHNDYADRKNGRKEISYLHPELAELLGDTYGLMIYQESMMRVAQRFAGFTLEEADNLRKACGKKNRELIAAERAKFVAGCGRTGYGEALGTALFDIIEPFADYAFNKSHSYGYGFVAYQTAWLKANFPVQYLAALLTSVKDDKDKTAVYLADAALHGISVLVPDVNVSQADFTVVNLPEGDQAISFGLASVRNVGASIVALIVEEREKNGPFSSFVDFCFRVDPTVLNRRAIESLIKAGGFDSLGHTRKGLLAVHDLVLSKVIDRRREMERGVFGLFDVQPDGEDVTAVVDIDVEIPSSEWSQKELLVYEKDMLGLYVSNHPLKGHERELRARSEHRLLEINETPERFARDEVVVSGIATAVVKRYTKRGDLMANFVLEDMESSIEVFVFARTMAEVGHLLEEDGVYLVRGRLDQREDQVKLVCRELEPIELGHASEGSGIFEITIAPPAASQAKLHQLRLVLEEHSGSSRVRLHVGSRAFDLPPELRVDASGPIVGSIKELFGAAIIGVG
ncbi:MAG: DNA polymerase III subunit alpha [Acidimicrobiales bacterium]